MTKKSLLTRQKKRFHLLTKYRDRRFFLKKIYQLHNLNKAIKKDMKYFNHFLKQKKKMIKTYINSQKIEYQSINKKKKKSAEQQLMLFQNRKTFSIILKKLNKKKKKEYPIKENAVLLNNKKKMYINNRENIFQNLNIFSLVFSSYFRKNENQMNSNRSLFYNIQKRVLINLKNRLGFNIFFREEEHKLGMKVKSYLQDNNQKNFNNPQKKLKTILCFVKYVENRNKLIQQKNKERMKQIYNNILDEFLNLLLEYIYFNKAYNQSLNQFFEKNLLFQILQVFHLQKREDNNNKKRKKKNYETNNLIFKNYLQKIPRNSLAVRLVNRCAITGRSRGVYRDWGISRIMFKNSAEKGLIPGLLKASW
jgi:ribosomal protein S14